MGRHEETLRRILQATGAFREVTEEQGRELITHLEEAIEEKTASGVAEPEAFARAFEEMGDLSKIARQFPRPEPTLVTPEGWMMSIPARAATAYAYLLVFCALQFAITSPMYSTLEYLRRPNAGVLWRLGGWMAENPWIVAGLLTAAIPGLFWLTRRRHARRIVLFLNYAFALPCVALTIEQALFLKGILVG